MMSAGDAFAPVRSVLERAGVRYAIGGSWASTAFGEPRFTNAVEYPRRFHPENLDRFLGSLPELSSRTRTKPGRRFASAGLST